jgi:hypothetical protein
MHKFNRRHVLASLGMMGGSALLSGCGRHLPGEPEVSAIEAGEPPRMATAAGSAAPAKAAVEQLAIASRDWSYRPLDPEAVGQLAYDIYPKGSCMYSVFGSVMMKLTEQVGEPFRSFPIDMMRFGAVGVGGWGSMCGVVNGCASLVGLFYSGEDDRKKREELIANVCLWYESESLPTFQPERPALDVELASSAAGSVLCHVSSGAWCKVAGCDAVSPERRERCRRLSAEGAQKVVEVLNDDANGRLEFVDISAEVHSCIECHGKDGQRDSLGLMNCMSCHQFDSEHP